MDLNEFNLKMIYSNILLRTFFIKGLKLTNIYSIYILTYYIIQDLLIADGSGCPLGSKNINVLAAYGNLPDKGLTGFA